ncbi:MAG TPA: glycerophosphodiester phosphodiesterase family protein [Verrucomicrobiales bacterium]|nr:glycerophosphodiester phosphodiesterase family protein [Verrucomicrobiales bacterium]
MQRAIRVVFLGVLPSFVLGARPEVIAHRGASFDAPENTLAAIREAVAQGSAAIELDAQMSADQEVVLVHDGHVNRTTDGQGAVAAFTLAELKALDAGSWFGSEFAGERIPALSEAIAEIGGRARLMVDSKGADPQRVRQVLLAEGVDLRGVTVFNWGGGQASGFLKHLPEALYLPTLPRMPSDWGPEFVARWQRRGGGGFAVNHGMATRAFLRETGRSGMIVIAWTVNEPARALQLAWLGVDGIITDKPGLIRQALEEADADGDGLEDTWEEDRFGSGGLAQGEDGDEDGDGLSNRWEQSAGTHPLRFDSDGDGLGDGWEWKRGYDPLDEASPAPEENLMDWAFGPDTPRSGNGMGPASLGFRLRKDSRLRWSLESSQGLENWDEADAGLFEMALVEQDGWLRVRVKPRAAWPGSGLYLRVKLRYQP